eukprot:7230070-Prymnesium_polylepis.3
MSSCGESTLRWRQRSCSGEQRRWKAEQLLRVTGGDRGRWGRMKRRSARRGLRGWCSGGGVERKRGGRAHQEATVWPRRLVAP